jgi:hypothetical protein
LRRAAPAAESAVVRRRLGHASTETTQVCSEGTAEIQKMIIGRRLLEEYRIPANGRPERVLIRSG